MSTKRVAAAAAGIGVTLATLTGATTAFGSPTPRPNIVVPGGGVTVTSGAAISFPEQTLSGDTSLAVPGLTITDPGKIASGARVTLTLSGQSGVNGNTNSTGAVFDVNRQPSVVVTGSNVIASKPEVTANTVSFIVNKSDDATGATFKLSGIYLTGNGTVTTGELDGTVSYNDPTNANTPNTTVRTFPFGAVTRIFPAVFGQTAADTAATLFRASVDDDVDSMVLATDYVPQDAESATYLAASLGTGIALTNRNTLSPAVSDILNDYSDIDTVYVIGGTAVISQNVVNALEKQDVNVVRLAGDTAYETNKTVINQVGNDTGSDVAIDYSETKYNTTSGSSSPTTTNDSAPQTGTTAIVASGDIRSFSDGIASGALAYKDGLPLFLTSPGSLDSGVRQLLISGDYDQVIVLGGPLAVSNKVVSQLTTTVDKGGAGVDAYRIAGASASETASLLASFETQSDANGNSPTGLDFQLTDQGNDDDNGAQLEGGVLIARGTGFQDALAAGPYAGGDGNTPILLTNSASDLGAPLGAYLKAAGAAQAFGVQALGGPLSVGAAVQQAAINAEVSGIPSTR